MTGILTVHFVSEIRLQQASERHEGLTCFFFACIGKKFCTFLLHIYANFMQPGILYPLFLYVFISYPFILKCHYCPKVDIFIYSL